MVNEKTFSQEHIEKKGHVRAMFYNIYGWMWYPDKANAPHLSSGPISLRQQMEAELFSLYKPDLIGMQEYSCLFHKDMTPLLCEIGYSEVDVSFDRGRHTDGTKLNYTPIFYRPDTLTLIDSGFIMYPETMQDSENPGNVLSINDVNTKSLTWAVFEEDISKKRFIAINTHFMYNAAWLSDTLRHEVRVNNALTVLDIVKRIREKTEYASLPVIMGGDLNCRSDTVEFKTLLDGGMKWLWDVAPIKNSSSGHKPYAVYDETVKEYVKFEQPSDAPEHSIDHVFYMPTDGGKEMEILSYVTVTDTLALLSSDHCPKMTDLNLL